MANCLILLAMLETMELPARGARRSCLALPGVAAAHSLDTDHLARFVMEAKLVVLAPAEIVNTEFKLQLPVTIGRGRDAKIKLVHGQISRLHCEVYEDNGVLKARDLGSLNGTFVDGQRVSDADLKPGGMLNIGSVTFRAVYGVMPSETDDSAVEFGAPRITDTVSTTSTVMEDGFPDFGTAEEAPAAEADDDLGMFDFTEEPAPAKAAAPAPSAPPADPAPVAAEADDELGMFDFAEEPAPAVAATPAPAAPKPAPKPARGEEPTVISQPKAAAPAKPAPAAPTKPAPAAPAAPAFVPPAEPAKAGADVDDWLNITESDTASPATEDDDLQSFFGNMK